MLREATKDCRELSASRGTPGGSAWALKRLKLYSRSDAPGEIEALDILEMMAARWPERLKSTVPLLSSVAHIAAVVYSEILQFIDREIINSPPETLESLDGIHDLRLFWLKQSTQYNYIIRTLAANDPGFTVDSWPELMISSKCATGKGPHPEGAGIALAVTNWPEIDLWIRRWKSVNIEEADLRPIAGLDLEMRRLPRTSQSLGLAPVSSTGDCIDLTGESEVESPLSTDGQGEAG